MTNEKRQRITPHKIREILDAKGSFCSSCGRPLVNGNFQVNHIIPLSIGGTNDVDNLQIVCTDCNSSKANRPFSEYLFEQFIFELLSNNAKYSNVKKDVRLFYTDSHRRLDLQFDRANNNVIESVVAEVSTNKFFTENGVNNLISYFNNLKEFKPN